MKVCPDCAEKVRSAARKCRYCGYRFDRELQQPDSVASAPDVPPSADSQPAPTIQTQPVSVSTKEMPWIGPSRVLLDSRDSGWDLGICRDRSRVEGA